MIIITIIENDYFYRAKRFAKKESSRGEKYAGVVGSNINDRSMVVATAHYMLKPGEKILALFHDGREIPISENTAAE